MNKPIIFFSHSSKDKELLAHLKELFCKKTGDTIDVFLSSDGQSIPLGRNWVHRVQEALEHCSVMVVFLTPNSIRSSWIYFEAGFAYSKGIRVIPVGFMGGDLAHISPPLSLLQGFNIHNKDGLDNLIALANEAFSYNHETGFTADEFNDLVSCGDPAITHALGEFLPIINEINISVNERDHLKVKADEALKLAWGELEQSAVEYRVLGHRIEAFGMTMSTTDGQLPKPVDIVLDPTLIDSTLPLVTNILSKACSEGLKKVSIRVDFADGIMCQTSSHKLTAKLYGAGVSMGVEDEMIYNGLAFSVAHYISFRGIHDIRRGATYLSITPQKGDITVKEIRVLIELLFARKVLYEEATWLPIDGEP